MIKHIVLTRLGIGIARPAFYRQHAALLEAGIFQSLRQQTLQDFEWHVVVDRQIDAESLERLKALFAPYPHFKALAFDPIEKGRMVPKIPDLDLAPAPDDLLALSRIDDDDIVSTDLIERIQAVIHENAETAMPMSVCFGSGADVYITQKVYRMRFTDSIALGLTLCSRGDAPLDIFGGNHAKIQERLAALGGRHFGITSDVPLWAYARRPGSDSFDVHQRRSHHVFKPQDAAFEALLERCGVARDWLDRLNDIQVQYPDPAAPLIGEPLLPRLQVKGKILGEINRLRKDGQAGNKRHAALVSAFYAV
jgi:hypothetical protein